MTNSIQSKAPRKRFRRVAKMILPILMIIVGTILWTDGSHRLGKVKEVLVEIDHKMAEIEANPGRQRYSYDMRTGRDVIAVGEPEMSMAQIGTMSELIGYRMDAELIQVSAEMFRDLGRILVGIGYLIMVARWFVRRSGKRALRMAEVTES